MPSHWQRATIQNIHRTANAGLYFAWGASAPLCLSTCTHRTRRYNQEMQTVLFATRTYTVEKKPTNIEEMQYREFLHSILPTINANRIQAGYKLWTFGALRMFLLKRGYGTVHHHHLQLLWNRCSDAEVPVRAWFARLK